MRSFRCYDCGHQFHVAHGVGGMGSQMSCPRCGSANIHRAVSDRGFARGARGRRARNLAQGRGRLGGGRRWARV